MGTPIKQFQTIQRNMLQGRAMWVLLPARTFGGLPIGLVDELSRRGFVRTSSMAERELLNAPLKKGAEDDD